MCMTAKGAKEEEEEEEDEEDEDDEDEEEAEEEEEEEEAKENKSERVLRAHTCPLPASLAIGLSHRNPSLRVFPATET